MECSNVYHAAKLKRPLMLVVGEMDDNVDPASTYQLVNALIKAGKDFELVALPGTSHTMGERYGEHKRFDVIIFTIFMDILRQKETRAVAKVASRVRFVASPNRLFSKDSRA